MYQANAKTCRSQSQQPLAYLKPGEVFPSIPINEPENGMVKSSAPGTINAAGHYPNVSWTSPLTGDKPIG
jgi:hypothetical protein